MAQRYVRIQTPEGQIHYGLLQLNHNVDLLDAAPWLGGQLTGITLPEERYQLLAPCTPSKIVAVGRNYSAHAAELGNEVPAEPLIFFKPPTAIAAEGQYVPYPKQSQRVDYEGELALVIGKPAKNCTVEQAHHKIWGYTIANDITARDLQKKDDQWTRAKGFDSFCPLGPWIVREISIDARLQTFLNDDPTPKQSALLTEMVFSPDVLVSYISQVMTLLPGDIILTGTPEGIGPMAVGDVVRVEIQGIGSLENTIVAPEID
ncbi:MAG: fumarylacetoacetate hydrolase family protein [Snowella sp.]|nr:fumarylacetoacetate hydrolase family protein [Snowella sp.]